MQLICGSALYNYDNEDYYKNYSSQELDSIGELRFCPLSHAPGYLRWLHPSQNRFL